MCRWGEVKKFKRIRSYLKRSQVLHPLNQLIFNRMDKEHILYKRWINYMFSFFKLHINSMSWRGSIYDHFYGPLVIRVESNIKKSLKLLYQWMSRSIYPKLICKHTKDPKTIHWHQKSDSSLFKSFMMHRKYLKCFNEKHISKASLLNQWPPHPDTANLKHCEPINRMNLKEKPDWKCLALF